MDTTDSKQLITALILAGGQGKRMAGKDKGLIQLNGHPLVAHIIQRIAPQVRNMLISANRNHTQYAEFGYPVLSDASDDYPGPLAGILTGLQNLKTPLMLVLPCDTPLLKEQFIPRLIDRLLATKAEIAVAHDGTRMQPIHALIRADLAFSLENYLHEGQRSVMQWYANHQSVSVDFSDQAEQFLNLNTAEDLRKLAQKTV